ncbi:Probable RNA polymerase II nuclear localization protein SLC7A6OS [Anthophora quadrimaculata]
MAAILRVKRRHEDEPLNALVISYKRQKTAKNEETEAALPDSLTSVAKFAGTVKKQEDSVEDIIRNYDKDELKANFKQHPVDIINKLRQITKQASAENRYKVINCFRSLDNSIVEDSEEKGMTVIDVEDSKSIANKISAEEDDSYVYDLYYVQTENDIYLDDKVSVHPYDQELVFDNYRDNGYSEVQCESEDSNSESNWRNDYPDSSHSEGSIDEDDMREAVMNMRLEEGSDLSEEDDFIYAVDESDVNAYGYKYARYKAKVKEQLEEDEDEDHENLCTSDSDENNDDCN